MKKRALAVTLAVMMAASLSACGSSNSGSGSTTAAPAETTTAAEAKATEAETTAGTAVKLPMVMNWLLLPTSVLSTTNPSTRVHGKA